MSLEVTCTVKLNASCEYCRSGNYNLCPEIKFAATPPVDGTLTKYYIVPHDMVVPLPENVTLEEGGTVFAGKADGSAHGASFCGNSCMSSSGCGCP
jgi:D-arabinose 1-dehydrogenase-like Zn-dependent alcohol dehydrogenase